MSYNGSGVFQINSTGQPVVVGTTVSDTVFNALTNDLATGLSNCVTKDGQQTVTANIPMASFKLTGLAAGTANGDSVRFEQITSNLDLSICNFRLTLTSATPVTTSDVTAATTLYVSPYKGNKIALYNGSIWNMRSSAEMSIAVPATTSTMYDLFCYDNAGTPTLEALSWTNDTTRATEIVLQDGVLSKTGALTRRYLGSFRTTTVSGQTEDSFANRFVWNYYNRVRRPMRVIDPTDEWNYTLGSWRQARATATNQLNFVVGYAEDAVTANVEASGLNSSGNVIFQVGLAVDSTSAPDTNCINGVFFEFVALQRALRSASLITIPAAGRHYIAWLEYSQSTGTTTWFGDGGQPTISQNGMWGELLG